MGRIRLISFFGLIGWFAIKFMVLGLWSWETSTSAGFFWHLLVVTVLAAFSAQINTQSMLMGFFDRWKAAARATVGYAILATAAMGAWYFVIAKGGLEARKQEQIDNVYTALGTNEAFQKLVATQPELEGLSRESILETQLNNLDVFYSPLLYLGLAMLAWMCISMLLSAVVDVLWQAIWRTDPSALDIGEIKRPQ
ncbi:MAG: hypothetical protein ACKVJH_09700 [Flavobacteriales bacterium]